MYKRQIYAGRREVVFLILSGLFLGTLAMLNILGISRFVDLSFNIGSLEIPMPLAIGVLPYPVTFLCTDFISELYGRKRANRVVWMGLLLNLWVMSILWLAGVLPGTEARAFFEIRSYAFAAVWASMVAYLFAQFVDVELFHWWKRRTQGKHLWLRNNGSTMLSQIVDTVSVILITFWLTPKALPLNNDSSISSQLCGLIGAGYVFKVTTALLDTIPLYLGVRSLRPFLGISEEGVPDP